MKPAVLNSPTCRMALARKFLLSPDTFNSETKSRRRLDYRPEERTVRPAAASYESYDRRCQGRKLMHVFSRTSLAILLFLVGSLIISAQVKPPSRAFVINGRSGQVRVIEMGGRVYVDLETLVHVADGSFDLQGGRIVLTLPASSGDVAAAAPLSSQPTEPAFSREFRSAGIEEITLLREWAGPLAYAIQNGYPVTEAWVAGNQAQAAQGLNLASVATNTDADRQALQLLANEFEAVKEWSNRLVEARKSMDAGKYAISANALRDDPLSQKIMACGRFLAAMLANGNFQDDSSCH